MTWTLPEPMLATPVPDPALQPGWAGEPKWDGFRALLSVEAGRVTLRSRRGTEMADSFPEVVAGAAQLPDATAMDGELVVWDAAGRLAFERLQNRLARRGAAAARAAEVRFPRDAGKGDSRSEALPPPGTKLISPGQPYYSLIRKTASGQDALRNLGIDWV
ncbi:hypothetical protein ACFZB2_40290 [Streptomyces bobili]|uniref:ATP-dependent DNA ligase n=1 Tax=Streptomyces bobili TaxID=67280 RepID=UPI0036E22BA0